MYVVVVPDRDEPQSGVTFWNDTRRLVGWYGYVSRLISLVARADFRDGRERRKHHAKTSNLKISL